MKILNNNNEYKADKELEKKARKIFNNNNEYKADKELEKKAKKKLDKKAWKDFKKERKLFYKTHPEARRGGGYRNKSLALASKDEMKKPKLDSVNDKNEEPSVIKRLKDALVYLFAIIAVIFYLLAFLGGIFNMFNSGSKTQEEFEYYQDINEPRGP